MTAVDYWTRAASRRLSRRQVVRSAALGGVGLAGAALIGCGGDDDVTPPAAATGSAAAATQGKPGGRMTYWLSDSPASYDIHATATSRTMIPVGPTSVQLVQFDPLIANDGPKGIIADIASTWEIAPDGQTYTFKLVQNAKFHDGTPLTAADVVASLNRQRTPPQGLVAPRQLQLSPIKTIETPDQFTVVLKMARPVPATTMLPILGQGVMGIYSKKDIDGGFDFGKTKPNGAGPFRMADAREGDRITYEKHKDYHVAGRPYLDGIDAFVISEKSTAIAQLQSGALHHTLCSGNNFSIRDIEDIKRAMGDKADYQTVPSLSVSFLGFNARRAPWSDQRVRHAIALTIDRKGLIQTVYGDGVPGGYMLPGGDWALPDAEIEKIVGYEPFSDANLTKAKQMFSAAGVKEGHKIGIMTENSVNDQAQSLYLGQMMKKLGIESAIETVTNAERFSRLQKSDYDVYARGLARPLDDPDAVFSESYISGAPGNFAGIENKAVDEAFAKQSMELNTERRVQMVKDLQKLSMPDLGEVILTWRTISVANNKMVKNYVLHASKYTNTKLQDVWLDR